MRGVWLGVAWPERMVSLCAGVVSALRYDVSRARTRMREGARGVVLLGRGVVLSMEGVASARTRVRNASARVRLPP
jgi:hypothetical protein